MVSVILNSFNCRPYLAAAIESVLAQRYTDLELIIVDDGSTDGSAALARTYCSPQVRLREQDNQGAAHALNAGIRLARGEFVAFLDGDDAWHPDKLQAQVDHFASHPEAALNFTWSEWIDEGGRPLRLHSRRCRGSFPWERLVQDFVIGATSSVMIRRPALERVGGFDPSLQRYYDMDLFLRVARLGDEAVQAVPRSLTYYRRRAGQMSRDWRGMKIEWELLAERLGLEGGLRRRAQSNMTRYFAFLAHEAGDRRQAVRLMAGSLARQPLLFLSDPRNWQLSLWLACWAALPPLLRKKLLWRSDQPSQGLLR